MSSAIHMGLSVTGSLRFGTVLPRALPCVQRQATEICTIRVAPEDMPHREINTAAESFISLLSVGRSDERPYTNSGTRNKKNRIGKAANGRSCLRAFQYWSPSVMGSYFDRRQTACVNFTMTTIIAVDAARRMDIAGASQRLNLSMNAIRSVVFSG